MVFAPSFYTKADSAKIVVYITYFLILIIFPLSYIFEGIFGLSAFTYTDTNLSPTSIPYYAALTPSAQSQTARYGLTYWILQSDYLRPCTLIVPVLLVFIGIRKSAMYAIFLIMTVIIAGVELIKFTYHLLAWLDCENFWYCRGKDLNYVPGSVSFEYWVIFGNSVATLLILLSLLALISALKQFMKLIIFQEISFGHVSIGQPINGQLNPPPKEEWYVHTHENNDVELLHYNSLAKIIAFSVFYELRDLGRSIVDMITPHERERNITNDNVVAHYLENNRKNEISHHTHTGTHVINFNNTNPGFNFNNKKHENTNGFERAPISNMIQFQ